MNTSTVGTKGESGLKDAMFLLKTYWSYSKFAFPLTIFVFAAYGGFAGMLLNTLQKENRGVAGFIADVIIVCFSSCAGFLLSKGYLNNPYWKNDSFSKQLASLRIVPIPVGTLALSRSLQVLILSPITMTAFFAVMYVSSGWAKELSLLTYLQFILVWFGCGNLVGAWHIVQEWSVSGRRYFWSSSVIVVLIIVLCAAVWSLSGTHLTIVLGEELSRPATGWAAAAVGLGVTVLSHVWMYRKLCATLLSRDFG